MCVGNVAIVMFAAVVAGCCGEHVAANREIRLASYNIFHCQGADKKIDPARTAAALAEHRPDFVGLQEVDSVTRRSGGLDQSEEMGKVLGMYATYAKTFPFQGGGYGIAILSREKPLSVERIPLPGKEPRLLLMCEFKDCWFGNTHLALQTANQLKSVEIIRKVVTEKSVTKPVFIVGDWNEEPTSKTLAAMRGFMTILSNEKSRTHHGFKPFPPGSEFCIDYIAVDSVHAGSFAVRDAHVTPDFTTSDHCPVFVSVTRKE